MEWLPPAAACIELNRVPCIPFQPASFNATLSASDVRCPQDGGGVDGVATPGQSTLNFVNCMMGAGILGFPFCFKTCGLLLATAMLLFCFVMSRASYQLLLASSHATGRRSFEDVAEAAFGRPGRQVRWHLAVSCF